ncbi:MAG: non-canonical purine NTP pyrophosphatase [Synergistaceae bacterium]|jgi:XTP/dITP diphosphohydrolase|nr:non-canonical purine NTP pyrophosphatase [Synergistaceae bacterium]
MIARLALATNNRMKYLEFLSLWPPDAGELVCSPGLVSVPETGYTYAQNAMLKAKAWAEFTGLPALADDSGLEVNALSGLPGIMSARIVEGTDADRNAWLLSQMEGQKNRHASFFAAVALALPDRTVVGFGVCRGKIGTALEGESGFGYDPLFVPNGYSHSFGSLPKDVKNGISHRAVAVRNLLAALRDEGILPR